MLKKTYNLDRVGSSEEFVSRARHHLARGQVDEAIRICRSGLKRNGASVAGRLMLAEALREDDNLNEALTHIGTALSLDRDNVEGIILQAEILLDNGEPETAHRVLDRVFALEPANRRASVLRKQALGRMTQSSSFDDPRDGTMELEIPSLGNASDMGRMRPSSNFDDEATRVAPGAALKDERRMSDRIFDSPKPKRPAPPPVTGRPTVPAAEEEFPSLAQKPRSGNATLGKVPQPKQKPPKVAAPPPASVGSGVGGNDVVDDLFADGDDDMIAPPPPKKQNSRMEDTSQRKAAPEAKPKKKTKGRESKRARTALPPKRKAFLGSAVLVAVAVSIVLGIQIRSCRTGAKVDDVIASADKQMAVDTFESLLAAEEKLKDAVELSESKTVARLAFVKARLRVEYGEARDKPKKMGEGPLSQAAALLFASEDGSAQSEALAVDSKAKPELQYAAAHYFLANGQIGKAEEAFDAVVRQTPGESLISQASAFHGLASAHLAAGKDASAATNLSTAQKFQPKNNLIAVSAAEVALLTGTAEAKLALSKLTGKQSPRTALKVTLLNARIAAAEGDAEKSLKLVGQLNPQRIGKRELLTTVGLLGRLGETSLLNTFVNAGVQRFGTDKSFVAGMGTIAVAAGELEVGRTIAKSLTEKDGGSALTLLGQVALADQEYDEARKHLTAASKLPESKMAALVALGELELATGNHKEAIKNLSAADQLTNSGYTLLAKAYRLDGNIAKAEKTLKNADQEAPETQRELAYLSIANGDWGQAKTHFKSSIEGGGDKQKIEYAKFLFNIGKAADSLEVLEQIDTERTPNVLAFKNEVLSFQGHITPRASETLELARKQSAAEHLIQQEAGRNFAASGSPSLAFSALETSLAEKYTTQAAELAAKSALAVVNDKAFASLLTKLKAKLGATHPRVVMLQSRSILIESTEKALKKLSTIDTSKLSPLLRAEYYVLQGESYQGGEKYAAAIESYQSALKLAPDYFDAIRGLGMAAFESGNLELSLKMRQRVVKVRSADHELWFELGETAHGAGKKKIAKDAFRRVIQLSAESSEAEAAQQLLADL